MSENNPINLYELLPIVYRTEDARRGYPLQALMDIISEQANIIHQDISRLWDNFFVETSDPWAIPYIGDLVGNNPIHEVVRGRRADVAKTVYYRLRKGTLPMLEEVARDVTGWPVHAVAFFDIMTWSQNMNHLRPSVGTMDIRDIDACDRVHGPFDSASHTVDVRPIGRTEGWHNIRNVGFFIWRLGNYTLSGVTPRPSEANDYGFHFSPLGNPAPLFNRPQRETEEAGLTREIHIAGPIRPTAFWAGAGLYYTNSMSITLDGGQVPLEDVICKDLSTWQQPAGNKVGIDVERGRLALGSGLPPVQEISVSYNYGFSADIGGGPYDRRDEGGTVLDSGSLDILISVPSDGIATIGDAIAAWDPAQHPRAVIEIENSRTFEENLIVEASGAVFGGQTQLVIQAANGQRPTLIGSISMPAANSPGYVTLNGLLIEGHVEVSPVEDGQTGALRVLEIVHCTLVPGRELDENGRPKQPLAPSLTAGVGNDLLEVDVRHSICGPLRLPAEMGRLKVSDSVIEGLSGQASAYTTPVLVSGPVSLRAIRNAPEPTINLTIGAEGPHAVLIRSNPRTTEDVRVALEAGIRAAHDSPAFRNARVARRFRRLVIIPGEPQTVTASAFEGDPTLNALRLNEGNAQPRYALISGPLTPFPTLTSQTPRLSVTMHREDGGLSPSTQPTIELVGSTGSLNLVRLRLQQALRRVPAGGSAFTGARVAIMDDRLIVVSGDEWATPVFSGAPDDDTTVTELALESTMPGPTTSMERVTVFGAVNVRALELASEVIFDDLVTCQRRQVGCVRFSYVPPGSVTPRRYRCQPELALEQVDREELDPVERETQKERIRRRLTPDFTERHYGHPAYAQLSLTCPVEIRTGAEEGSEMGAFQHLMQPHRESNLRIRLEEYLPFGLEPGAIYIT